MLEALKKGQDIHRENAARLFKKKPEDVTKLERDAAKSTVSFSLIYGRGVKSMADLSFNGDIEYAQFVHDSLFNEMPAVKTWIEAKHREVIERDGLVRVDLFDHDMDTQIRSTDGSDIQGRREDELLRKSVNTPVQSLSSSINGYLGYRLYVEALRQGIPNLPLAFTHDAWIMEIPIEYLFQYLELIKYYFKTYPYKELGLPADCDFDLSITKYMPKEITYDIEGSRVRFKVTVPLLPGNDHLVSMIKSLPGFELISEESKDKILDSQSNSDLLNGKCSWGPNMGKPITHVTIEGYCDYVPTKPSELMDSPFFSDNPININIRRYDERFSR